MSRSRQQLRDVASCFAALNSYDSEAAAIKTATASLLGGKQKDLRTLCSAKWVAGDGKQSGWGVKRCDGFGDNRKDADIRRDLEKSVLRRARAYLSKIGVAEPASVLSSASRQQNDGSQTAVHQPSHGGDPDMTSQQSTAGDGAPTQGSPLSSEGLQSHPSTVGAAEHASSPASIARNESSRHDLLTPDWQSSSSKQDAAPQCDSNSLNDINASGHGWGPASASLQQSGGRQTAALLPRSLGNQRTSISSITSSNQDACQQGASDQDDALQRSSASGGAAEHASSSAAPKTGPVDADTVLENLQALLQQHAEAIVVRVVDHACSSSACISSRLKAVCQAAGLPSCNLSCTLLADQALDACGYIGADAAVTLRDAALGLGDRWLQAPLRPYHSNACVKRGNNLLGRPGDVNASMLATEDVNTLVHAYANLKQHLQAQEDWWGGAVALDHFATGVGDFLCSAHGSDDARMHQWRTWVVNTQTSTQDGSHWFTVAIGLRGLRESLSAQVSHNAASGHEGGDPGGSACAGPPGTAKSKVQSGGTRTHRNDIEECAGAAEHAPHGAATPAVHAAPQAKRPRTI